MATTSASPPEEGVVACRGLDLLGGDGSLFFKEKDNGVHPCVSFSVLLLDGRKGGLLVGDTLL
jgi:sensor domain CHASE-containing protein